MDKSCFVALNDETFIQFQPQEVRTPEINDEKTLYDMNAEVRLESRRRGDTDVAQQMLQKFKAENPFLIERLKLHRSNERTDCSANYTLSNSRQHRSKQISNRGVISPPRRINHSDDVSSNTLTSALEPSEERAQSRSQNYGPVKSSNELLNSKIFFDKNSSNVHNSTRRHEMQRESTNLDNNIKDRSHENVESSRTSIQMEVDEAVSTYNQSSLNTTNTENLIRNGDSEENIDQIDISDDSDIAEALTQVIEEFSIDNHNLNSDTSLDEEFISDVVNEINDELISGTGNIDNIVLTPPFGFRDE